MTETAHQELAEALFELGFSQYEAKCYVGLMNQEPQTGYRVSKTTGVPQPKVYETLRRLVSRGVVREIAGDPTLFSAIPPTTLLDELKATFDRRLDEAERTVQAMDAANTPRPLEYVERFDDRADIIAAARLALDGARRRVYLSASAGEIADLEPTLREAIDRGVDVVLLAFGRREVDLAGARVFRHSSTEGSIYRHHQARHLALIVDSAMTVNAVAADGAEWHGIRTASEPVVAAVKGFIRHDIDMQQVYADFGDQLVAAYGPGLQTLGAYRQDHTRDLAEEQGAPARAATTA
ncbi:TrmB family transcriptional regulator [Microbacterium sp. RD1]|uniref:TrmB family transcriptional regulator n=1 Tax=Microbacterium sp. RD1 TaxID=3457313 RepID=UPI003FA57486